MTASNPASQSPKDSACIYNWLIPGVVSILALPLSVFMCAFGISAMGDGHAIFAVFLIFMAIPCFLAGIGALAVAARKYGSTGPAEFTHSEVIVIVIAIALVTSGAIYGASKLLDNVRVNLQQQLEFCLKIQKQQAEDWGVKKEDLNPKLIEEMGLKKCSEADYVR